MGKTAFRYLCALLAILFASCSKEGPLDKMEHIKMVGNDHPKQALAMLDSLEQEARRGSVYAQKKYDLLHIRLSDKANILPKSDAKIKELVEYFGKKGSDQEKQRSITMQAASIATCKTVRAPWSISTNQLTSP